MTSIAVATTGTGGSSGGAGTIACTGLPANAIYASGATSYMITSTGGSATASYT